MRAYMSSHPWLTFNLNLSQAIRPKLWLLLGEIQSKAEHIAGVPLRPTVAKKLHALYLAKGVAATTAIEGNTLSEFQVLEKIEGTLRVPPSQEYLEQEVANMLLACKMITRAANRQLLKPLSAQIISVHNKLVLKDLPLEEGVLPGEITHAVTVGRYRGAPREDCKFLLDQLCDWLNSSKFDHPDLSPLVVGVLKAIMAHLYLAWIHPFGDGNGRTARLLEFRLLLQAGVPSPAAHLLSNHYNLTRAEYYRQLDYSSKSKGDVLPFLLYALEGFRDGLRSQLAVVRKQQFDLTWRSLIFNEFKDKHSKGDIRRRILIWEISKINTPIDIDVLPSLNGALAKEYTNLSDRTLMRDLEELVKLDLLEYIEDKRQVRSQKNIVYAFLPSAKIDGVDWSASDSGR